MAGGSAMAPAQLPLLGEVGDDGVVALDQLASGVEVRDEVRIATEGQHVTVDYMNHCVLVDGVPLEEPYILELMQDPNRSDMPVVDVTVPEGSIYVLGDNRNHSSDSRSERLGTVDTRYVLGRVLCILLPFDHFGAVE